MGTTLKPNRVHYNGDINLENGGYFYTLKNIEDHYADAVRITPCSDAGAQSNAFWIESLTINLPTEPDDIEKVLNVIGLDVEDLPSGLDGQIVLLEACMAYGRCDHELGELTQIGAEPEGGHERVRPDKILRRNWTLEGYVKKHWLGDLK